MVAASVGLVLTLHVQLFPVTIDLAAKAREEVNEWLVTFAAIWEVAERGGLSVCKVE